MRDPKLHIAGAIALLAAAVGLALYGQPTPAEKWQFLAPKYAAKLTERQVYIDPAELLQFMHDDYVDLLILDVRPEPDWNQFHLVDAERVTLDQLPALRKRLQTLSGTGVVVLVSNDELQATEAWKHLMVLAKPNAYILEGGLNQWLSIYAAPADAAAPRASVDSGPDGTLRHHFKVALGDRHAASLPDTHQVPHRDFTPKVKLMKTVAKARGCG